MRHPKLTLTMLLLVFCTMLNAAGKRLPNGGTPKAEAWIPADINLENITLLIMKQSYINKKGKDYYQKENDQLENVMKKNYPYKYELVVNAVGDKYKDKATYPYMFFFSTNRSNYKTTSGESKGNNGSTIEIIDMRTGKSSPTNGWSYGFKYSILEATVKQLVKVYKERKAAQK